MGEASPGIPSRQKPVPSRLLARYIFYSWMIQPQKSGKRCVGQPCQRRARHSSHNMGWQHPGLCYMHGKLLMRMNLDSWDTEIVQCTG